jgi:hypothetical protein
MLIESRPIIFTNITQFDVLPKKVVDTLSALAIPLVRNVEIYRSPSSAVNVTNFKGGAEGQDLYILGNGNVTLVNGATIKTSTGANKVLAANKIYHLKYIDAIWYEVTN